MLRSIFSEDGLKYIGDDCMLVLAFPKFHHLTSPQVRNIILCGHYGCGAVKAALKMPSKTHNLVNCWISGECDVPPDGCGLQDSVVPHKLATCAKAVLRGGFGVRCDAILKTGPFSLIAYLLYNAPCDVLMPIFLKNFCCTTFFPSLSAIAASLDQSKIGAASAVSTV